MVYFQTAVSCFFNKLVPLKIKWVAKRNAQNLTGNTQPIRNTTGIQYTIYIPNFLGGEKKTKQKQR